MNPSQLPTKTRHARRTNVIRLIVARLPIRSHSVQAFVGYGIAIAARALQRKFRVSSASLSQDFSSVWDWHNFQPPNLQKGWWFVPPLSSDTHEHCTERTTQHLVRLRRLRDALQGFRVWQQKGMLENPCETARAFVPGAQKQRSDCVHGCQNLDKRIWQANIAKCTSCFSCGRCGEDNGHVFFVSKR